MIAPLELRQYYVFTFLIIILSASLLVFLPENYLAVLSVVSICVVAFFISHFNFSPLYTLLILVIPFSFNLVIKDYASSIIVPSEPIVAMMFLAGLFHAFRNPAKYKEFVLHPLSILIGVYLGLVIISLMFSTMIVVSIKAVIVKLAYIGVFYFIMHLYLTTKPKNGWLFMLLYAGALILIIPFTLFQHALEDFTRQTAAAAVHPFFSDHTIYSTVLVFLLPVVLVVILNRKKLNFSYFGWSFYLLTGLLILTGIYFSFSRAAWASLAITLLIFPLLLYKVKIRYLALLALFTFTLIGYNWNNISTSLAHNRYDSNARNTTALDKVRSISNISNDQSNAERLNRWKSALKMFEEKPMLGFGPGTYQFQYLHFQRQKDMTEISVTTPYNATPGKGGSAHSEFLLNLSESGIPAFLLFLLLTIYAVLRGIRNYYESTNIQYKLLSLAVVMGLISFLIHSFFNNFLDTDKVAILFWGSLSIIVTIHLQLRKSQLSNNL